MTAWDSVSDAWHSIPAIVRDIGIAVLVILILMGGLWVYTSQPITQAPLVVVESGSMMHDDTAWGRLGTIDPGDLILVKDVDAADKFDVVTLYGARSPTDDAHPGEGAREGYGLPGDVVIYRQDQCPRRDATPIIHRAVTWVEVSGTDGNRRYAYHNANGQWLEDQPNVNLPSIHISNNAAFEQSGWITKGDNTVTNVQADQLGICRDLLIQPDWVIGKARGEIPWVGLLKFMVQGNNVNNPPPDWCTPGRAVAPCDLFQALFLTLFIMVAIPLVWDVINRFRRRKTMGGDDEPLHNHAPPGPPPGRPPASRPFEGSRPPRPPPARPHPPKEGTTHKPRWARDDDESR